MWCAINWDSSDLCEGLTPKWSYFPYELPVQLLWLLSLWIQHTMKSPFPPRGFVCFSLWSLNTPWYRHCSPWILSLLFERAQFLSLHKGAKLVWKYPSNKKGVKEGKPKEAHKWSINKVTTDSSLDWHRKDMFKGEKFLDFMWTMVKFVGCGCHQSAGISVIIDALSHQTAHKWIHFNSVYTYFLFHSLLLCKISIMSLCRTWDSTGAVLLELNWCLSRSSFCPDGVISFWVS